MKRLFMFILFLSLAFSQQIDRSTPAPIKIVKHELYNIFYNFSQNVCQPQANVFMQFVVNTLLALLISALFGVAAYFLRKTFAIEKDAHAMLMMRLTSLITSAVIFAIVMASFLLLNLGNNYGYMRSAQAYAFAVATDLISYGMTLTMINIVLSYLSQLQINLPLHTSYVFSIDINFQQLAKPVLDASFMLSNAIIVSTGTWFLKIIFLCIINKYFLTFLFPIGIFLRSFNLTKGAGNALVAISLTFYIFYPIVMSLSYSFYELTEGTFKMNRISLINDVFAEVNGAITIAIAAWGVKGGLKLGNALLKIFALNKLNTGYLSRLGRWLSSKDVLSNLGNYLSGVASQALYISLIVILGKTFLFKFLPGVLYIVIVYSMLLTAFNIYATLVLTRELSSILGSEIDLSAFVRLL